MVTRRTLTGGAVAAGALLATGPGPLRGGWEPLLAPSRVTATWSMEVDLVDGRTYRNRGIAVFQTRDGRIHDFEEWFDTRAFLAIFGPDGSA